MVQAFSSLKAKFRLHVWIGLEKFHHFIAVEFALTSSGNQGIFCEPPANKWQERKNLRFFWFSFMMVGYDFLHKLRFQDSPINPTWMCRNEGYPLIGHAGSQPSKMHYSWWFCSLPYLASSLRSVVCLVITTHASGISGSCQY